MADVSRRTIFLSHAGEDAEFALRFAGRIEHEWSWQVGEGVEVFCTSKPEHRFTDVKEALHPASVWSEQYPRWKEELRHYLRQNLIASKAYVLLVTKQSLAKNSEWIEFEIDLASEQAKEKQRFFFPCAGKGARLLDLPEKAKIFQRIQLDSDDAVKELVVHASREGIAD